MADEPEPLVEAVNRLGDLVAEDIDMRKREALSRQARESQTAVETFWKHRQDDRPHQFSYLTMARAVPGLLAEFSGTVPGEFWNEDSGEALVACPCGETPAVPFNAIRGCGCERIFAFTGRDVRVANSPKGQPEAVRVD